MERKSYPSPMCEKELLEFSKAAESAARERIGKGTPVHTPESIAADKTAMQLENIEMPRNVTALGRRAGKNGAHDCQRRNYVERKYFESVLPFVKEATEGDVLIAVANEEAHESLREALFSMNASEFIYPLACDALGFPMTLVAKAINHATGRELSRAAHAKRGKVAKQRLSAMLDRSMHVS